MSPGDRVARLPRVHGNSATDNSVTSNSATDNKHMSQPDLSVVFPVYNEEENVPILLREIAAALEGRGWTYEIVAVDDGSTDRSLDVLRANVEQYPMLRVLALKKNSGQTAALNAAWRNARGRVVVSLDA